MKVQFSVLGLAMACVQVQGRQWQEIIDHDIAMKSNVDSSRYELKIEADPFATTKAGEKTASKIPTVPANHANVQPANYATVQSSNNWSSLDSFKPNHSSISTPNKKPGFSVVTGSGSGETPKESNTQPTNSWNSYKPNQNSVSTPINKPSFSTVTSSSTMNVAQESTNGCVKYELHMMDTWGDGWGKTSLTITGIESSAASMETTHTNSQGDEVVSISQTIQMNAGNKEASVGQVFQGGLGQGFHDSKEMCFVPGQCYQLLTSGGEFSDEASWELRPAGSETQVMLSGGASTGCTFSLPDANGHHACPKTCSNTIFANAANGFAPVAGSQQPQMHQSGEEVNVVPRHNPVTDLMASSASAGNTESASSMWSKFKNTSV